MNLLPNLNKKAGNLKLTTTLRLNKGKDTENANSTDSQAATATQASVTEVTVVEVAKIDQQGDKTEAVVTEATIMKMLSQMEVSNSLKEFDLSKTLTQMPSLPSSINLFASKTAATEIEVAPPLDSHLESVYIVLRPLKLADAYDKDLKKLGRLVTAIEFENYLLLQHWGVLIGDRYYHLHLDDNKKLSVSLVPFIDKNHESRHTIKIPIWRTNLSHEERVGIAVGIVKEMGNFKAESEVEITDENENKIVDPEDRKRFGMEGRYLRPPIPSLLFKGGYDPLTNNCIHFTKHYVFEQLLLHMNGVGFLASNIQWIVKKWIEMGFKKSPKELAAHLAGLFGITNPFSMTPTKSAKVLIKLLSIFLDMDYNSSLDEKPLQTPTSNGKASAAVADDKNVEA